jgi:prepilin-type N-terminal cleavage/methylation domain-containing protein
VKFSLSNFNFEAARARRRTAFTLIEILVAMALMSLIVLALMAVFNSTQTAFRAGLTQTDVLEGSRATMDLIKSDLEEMTPSDGFGMTNGFFVTGAVNFCVTNNNFFTAGYSPLYQSLPAVVNTNTQRTNVLESFFLLSRGNVNGSDSWIGTGYAVVATNLQNDLYPLYRFTAHYPVMMGDSSNLFYSDAWNYFSNNFSSFLQSPTNNGSHLIDGVVHLRVYAVDNNGQLMNAPNYIGYWLTNIVVRQLNTTFVPDEYSCIFYSNKVPSAVEIEMGVLEDKTLEHAESFNASIPAQFTAQINYLAQHAGQVHIFRQRVPIRNVDPTAYQ